MKHKVVEYEVEGEDIAMHEEAKAGLL